MTAIAMSESHPPPRLPPPSYLYPSPISDSALPPSSPFPTSASAQTSQDSSRSLHRNSFSHFASPAHPLSFAHQHPPLHRSDTLPLAQHRPTPFRTNTSLLSPNDAMSPDGKRGSEFGISNPVGNPRQSLGGRDDEDREDLTTKGKKRKRLAKACSACHKNKRRCDGFAPCSNCEFSSRQCLYVNAQGEVIPPPRTRETTKLDISPNENASGNDDLPTASASRSSPEKRKPDWDSSHSDRPTQRIETDKDLDVRSFADGLELVDQDPAFSSELLDIFFQHIQPFASMLHGPTFHYRLFLGRTSPLLLDAMYAMSAHLSSNSAFLATLPPKAPQWSRGEAFADRAQLSAKRMLDVRAAWSEETRRQDRGTWEETEFVQALLLLSIYFACVRQSGPGLYFLDQAIDVLRPNGTASLAAPITHLGLSTIDYLTLLECRNRTFWMLVMHDLCAAANGRKRRLLDHELYNIPLPGEESQWDRWGGGGSSGRESSKRDCLAPGTGTWSGHEGQIGELGHVLRVLVVFSDIMALANSGGSSGDNRKVPAQLEMALKSWALSLPRNMRFGETTLSDAVAKLNSPVPSISRSGWLFTYMHAIAECGMFYLQAAMATNGASWTAQRQSQAVDNITVILEAIGPKGRGSPMMFIPLLVVSNWHDHLRSSPAGPTAQQVLLDQRLTIWWADAARDWGYERRAATDKAPHADQFRTGTPRLSTSGLGLYSVSPSRPSESTLSVSSSSISKFSPTIEARVNGTSRYSQPSLSTIPTVRQRSHTITLTASSPGSHRRALPSIGSVTGLTDSSSQRNEIRLPPLPPMDPSPSGTNGGFKFPSFWSKEKEDDRGRNERPRPGRSPSPKARSWARERDDRPSVIKEDISPKHRSPAPQSDQNKPDETMGEEETGPVGIDALISAAEAKSDEEREARERQARLSV